MIHCENPINCGRVDLLGDNTHWPLNPVRSRHRCSGITEEDKGRQVQKIMKGEAGRKADLFIGVLQQTRDPSSCVWINSHGD